MLATRHLRAGLFAATLAGALLAALLVALAAGAGSARAQEEDGRATVVGPNGSINAAIRQASPGDTIVVSGTHRENVVIRKNGITLRGDRAVIKPPPGRGGRCGPSGICLLGDVDFQTGEVSSYVRNVTITNITVRNFRDTGIIAFGARDATFEGNRAYDNRGYGIAAFISTGTRVLGNTTRGSGDAGIYIGSSPNANAKVRGNETYRNLFGIFVRDARGGTIEGNRSHDNCLGVLFLADAPGPAGNFAVEGNKVRNNTRACPAEDGAPPVSGVGVALLGASGVDLRGNTITGNVPSGPSAFRGGVAVVRGIEGTAPRNNSVVGNTILGNRPDVSYDGSGSGNRFVANNCATSNPASICD